MASQAPSKQQGHVHKWQDDKGFGFIETSSGASLFFHISEFRAQRRPEVGEAVVFDVGQDSQGRLQARKVQELSFVQQKMAEKNRQIRQRNRKRNAQAEFAAGQKKRLFLGIGLSGVVILFAATEKIIWIVVAWYVVLGIVPYLTYAYGKIPARYVD